MNPNHSNRKKILAFALIAVLLAASTAIVVISGNHARVDEAPSASLSPAPVRVPAQLDPGMAPPPGELAGRVFAAETGEQAHETDFFGADGKALRLGDFQGRGLVINFWATWCQPCIREMPAIDNLKAILQPRGVEVIAVSVDRKAMEKVPGFFERTGIRNLDIYYDERGVFSRQLGVSGLPTTVLVKSDGTVLGSVSGMAEWDSDEISTWLATVLAGESPGK